MQQQSGKQQERFKKYLTDSHVKMTNNIDNVDMNGNYVGDPIFVWSPIRRDGFDIYFYGDVTEISQLVLIRYLNDMQTELLAKNAMSINQGGMESSECIRIHINSCGGLLSAGLAIYDFIKRMQVHTIGIVEGNAMSAASLILLACDSRQMLENSSVLIHQLSGGMIGKYSEMIDEMNNVHKAMEKLIKIYLNETFIGMTPEQIEEALNKSREEGMTRKDFLEYLSKYTDERKSSLLSLLSSDLELNIDECRKFGIIDPDVNIEDIEFTEEEENSINNFIQNLLSKKEKAAKENKKKKTEKTPKKSNIKKGKVISVKKLDVVDPNKAENTSGEKNK